MYSRPIVKLPINGTGSLFEHRVHKINPDWWIELLEPYKEVNKT